MDIDRKRLLVLLALMTVLGAAVRLYGSLEQPPFADEVLMAFTAQGYREGGQTLPTMPHHPNLRNILISLSLKMFGPGSMGLRAFSLMFGALSIPVLGMLVYKITKRPLAASLAAFFLALDPLHVTFSIQAIQETHVTFFALFGTYMFMIYTDRKRTAGQSGSRDALLLPFAGLIFGLGIASKYQAVFPLLVCFAVALWMTLRARDAAATALVVVSLVLIPLTVLMLTDAPWFGRGYGLDDWLFMRRALFERMSGKLVLPVMETNPDRSAWEWFVKPFLGYSSFSLSEGKTVLSVGMGNPLVWMLVLPSSLYLALDPKLRKQGRMLQALFWLSYLPFIMANRPIFLLSALACLPFGFGLLGLCIDHVAARVPSIRLLYLYVGVVFVTSALMLPLCVGQALDYGYTKALVEPFNPHPH